MSETTFENAKVGDTIYHWEEPHLIVRMDTTCSFAVIPDDRKRNYGSGLTYDGKEYEDEERGWFWLPVPKPVPPERPKRKVKKTVEGWLNVYRCVNGTILPGKIHTTEAEARAHARPDSQTLAVAVHLTGEYEVEE